MLFGFLKENFNPLTSWRARIGLTFTLATIVMIALLGYFFWEVIARQQIEENIRGELEALAGHLIVQLDENLFERRRDIQLLSYMELFTAAERHEYSEMRTMFDRLREEFSQDYIWMAYVGLDGRVVAASDGLLEGEDVSGRSWFTEALTGDYLGDLREVVLLADLIATPDGEPLRVMDIAFAVRDSNGEVSGVVAAHLTSAAIHERMRSYLSVTAKNANIRYALFNRDGAFIMGDATLTPTPTTRPALTAAAPPGMFDGRSATLISRANDTPYIISFASSQGYQDFPGLGWRLVLQQDASQAFALSSGLQARIVLFGAGMALAFSIIGWVITGRLTRPLVEIAKAADHIRAGNLDAKMPDIRSADEVGRLSASLNRLIDDLTEQLRQSEAAQQAILQSQQLEVALKETQEHSQMKDAFISFLSHEARTPLAVIMSSASMLEDYFDRFSPERRGEHLQRIISQGRYMTGMMDDLLIVSRGRMGKLDFKPEPLDMEAYCRQLVHEASETASHTHRFVVDITGLYQDAHADPRLLRHILGNLLNNAIKYSPNGGEIRLSLRRMPDPSHSNGCEVAVIRVSDEGIGIPETDQPQLFESFYRASNARHIVGTGLGLSIVRESVVRHGGTITFVSSEGGGTTFIVTLPVFACDD